MKTFAHGLQRNRRIIVSALMLTCSSIAVAQMPARSFVEMMEHVELIPRAVNDSEMLAKVNVAVGFIKRMELAQAQLAVNEALQLDPRNAYLHFLNGFVYHLQALRGDTQKAEIALEGYQQSLRIDPSNWIALEFMGLAYMDLKRFDLAKQAFADALLLTPESAPSISGLMISSYLSGDAKTACAMANHYLKVSAKPPLEFLRSSIPVYGSCGNFARAEWVRAALIEQYGNTPELERIDRRLEQWKTFYNDRSLVLAQAFSVPDLSPAMTESLFAQDSQDTESEQNITAAPQPSAIVSAEGPRMLLVDVVLLSTQELMSTSRGVNLLNALTMQLGSVSGNLPAYSRITSSNDDASSSTSITRAVTIPALSYSLNIANANNSVNEVLARPTLAAIEGLSSEFFSGTNLSAGVVSTSQEGGTTIVPLEKRFGIKLSVTPNFLSQGQVQLKVDAQRTSLNASNDNPRVAYQIEIGETTANANVVMNLGDTLVLSGLSEKSSSSTRDGVPGLQNIPGIQYLFSNKRTNELQRSVLILVTPRAPVQLSDAAPSDNEPMNSRMKQLRERFGFAERTPANIEAILTHLQKEEYYREFRQSDVSLERWDRMHATGERLKEALRFLYY
jgi:tetratricopeptide (TPR) repeat protein